MEGCVCVCLKVCCVFVEWRVRGMCDSVCLWKGEWMGVLARCVCVCC